MRALVAILLFVFSSITHAQFTAPEPEDLIFYQIFLDRFNNGDPGNDDGNPRAGFSPANPGGFHGGDLEGIRQKLPYIRGLGANAIWITPFLENVNSYHGYGAYNWYNVDPNFGDLAKLQQLCSEANAIGIGIYYDMVCNHAGDLIDSTDPGYGAYRAPPATYNLRWRTGLQYPAPFNNISFFHAHGHIGAFNDPEQQLGELFGLDDLKTEDTTVRNHLYDIWNYWVTNTGVSGFRIDTVKHAELGLWGDLLPRLEARAAALGRPNFFTFGEIYGADDNYMRTYVGSLNAAPYKMDAALDFQYFYTSNDVFATATGATANFVNRLQARAASLGSHHLKMPNFVDNHDVQRFLNYAASNPGSGLTERRRRLDLALVAMFTAPGPPIVYYGTEQDFDGGNDPYNREDMWDGQFESGPSVGDNFNTASPRYSLTKRLAQLRSALAPLRRGSLVARVTNAAGPGVLAYSRQHAGSEVLVVLNTSTSNQSLPAVPSTWPQGQVLQNALDPTQFLSAGAGGGLPARTITAQAAEIWLRQQDMPPELPQVVAFSPADGAIGVTSTTQITIYFNIPMDRMQTQAAIHISPATTGTVNWESGDTVMRFTPSNPLFARTNYTVTVSAAAKSATQQSLAYPVSARWQTARDAGLMPPMPPVLASLQRTTATITIDGNGNDWGAPPGQAANTGMVSGQNVMIWKDAIGDDAGPGAYLYPTNSVFTGADADLAEFRVAFDAVNFYIFFKPVSVGPTASFYTPYFGVGVDLASGGRNTSLGFDQQANIAGIVEVQVRPEAAPEYEIVFTGPRGAQLVNAAGASVASLVSAYQQGTGDVEIRVPRASLGLSQALPGTRLNLVPYTALETFGSSREVEQSRGEWSPGGGITEATDPDVFDLAGSDSANQQTDLGDFDTAGTTVILRSILGLELWDSAPSAVPDWQLY